MMPPLDVSSHHLSYADCMGEDGAHIRLKLDTDEPIALSNFVGSFVGIGNQFEKFVASDQPGMKIDSEFFVKEVRAGCVEADLVAALIPIIPSTLPGIIDAIDKAQILQKFVEDFASKIRKYFTPGGREPTATKSDLSDFMNGVSAIAADPNASARLESAVFEDGERKVRAALQFSSADAREAQRQIADHRRELEAKTDTDYERVLMRFVRPSVEAGKPGRKSERAIIEKIHSKPLPVLYASEMAENRVRHELLNAEGNVFRLMFDVDVNVELNQAGKPMAFRVIDVHNVIDTADDEG